MNCDGSPDLAWTQQDLYIPQQTLSFEKEESDDADYRASPARCVYFLNILYEYPTAVQHTVQHGEAAFGD